MREDDQITTATRDRDANSHPSQNYKSAQWMVTEADHVLSTLVHYIVQVVVPCGRFLHFDIL